LAPHQALCEKCKWIVIYLSIGTRLANTSSVEVDGHEVQAYDTEMQFQKNAAGAYCSIDSIKRKSQGEYMVLHPSLSASTRHFLTPLLLHPGS
jgi:hypothetical protein